MAVEKDGENLRLVVYENGVEKVCRKESLKKLQRFIGSDEKQLFKGRLQLHKENGEIIFKVKGEDAGKMTIEEFSDYMKK